MPRAARQRRSASRAVDRHLEQVTAIDVAVAIASRCSRCRRSNVPSGESVICSTMNGPGVSSRGRCSAVPGWRNRVEVRPAVAVGHEHQRVVGGPPQAQAARDSAGSDRSAVAARYRLTTGCAASGGRFRRRRRRIAHGGSGSAPAGSRRAAGAGLAQERDLAAVRSTRPAPNRATSTARDSESADPGVNSAMKL